MSLQIKHRSNTFDATQSELLDLRAGNIFTCSKTPIYAKIGTKVNQANVYTKVYVDAKINNLVNNAPEALKTLGVGASVRR